MLSGAPFTFLKVECFGMQGSPRRGCDTWGQTADRGVRHAWEARSLWARPAVDTAPRTAHTGSGEARTAPTLGHLQRAWLVPEKSRQAQENTRKVDVEVTGMSLMAKCHMCEEGGIQLVTMPRSPPSGPRTVANATCLKQEGKG